MKSKPLTAFFKCLIAFLFLLTTQISCTSDKHTEQLNYWNSILRSTGMGYSVLEEQQVSVINREWYNKWLNANSRWNKTSKEQITSIVNQFVAKSDFRGLLFSGLTRQGIKGTVDVAVIEIPDSHSTSFRGNLYIISSRQYRKIYNIPESTNSAAPASNNSNVADSTTGGAGINTVISAFQVDTDKVDEIAEKIDNLLWVVCYNEECLFRTQKHGPGYWACRTMISEELAWDCEMGNECLEQDSPCRQRYIEEDDGVDPDDDDDPDEPGQDPLGW